MPADVDRRRRTSRLALLPAEDRAIPDHPQDPVRAAIGLGTNVGDRLATIEAALWALDDSEGIHVVDVSGVWETAPWGGVDQGPYLNAVALVDTTLSPRALLGDLQATEAAFGRDRAGEVRWGPRTLDLDILLYGELEVDDEDLVVPHPRLVERAFVLVPLMEVLPGGTLPDGTRLTTAMTALAPVDGIDLHVRLSDHPGRDHLQRPDGPSGGRAWLASDGDGRGPRTDDA